MLLRFTSHLTPVLTMLLTLAVSLGAQAFELRSDDIKEGHPMPNTFAYNGFGCTGENHSPQLSWNNPPTGTKSFAITAYDPDAPTGSGWWHWLVINLPNDANSLERGASGSLHKRMQATEVENDFGSTTFGGACPPKGQGMHRYVFTVWALPKASLDINKDTPAAQVGYALQSMALDKARITATYAH